jgi:hypothetical protein
MDQTELISAIDRWQEEGRALRERLLSERDALAKRLGEIDKRLSMIPTEKGADGPGHAIRQPQEATLERVSPRDSLADVVRKLLRAAAKPLAAGEVVGRVLEARPSAEKTHVHSALFRLKKAEEVEVTGEPGSLKYQWKQ